MTRQEMQTIREVLWLNLPMKEANDLIFAIEKALGVKQDASRPGYKGVLA